MISRGTAGAVALPALELAKMPPARARRRFRDDGDGSMLVHGAHSCGLQTPVGHRVLQDAQRIDPQVFDTQLAADGYRVLEGWGQIPEQDALPPLGKVTRRRRERLSCTPAVAQGSPSAGASVRH
jgi:hypothetical protein